MLKRLLILLVGLILLWQVVILLFHFPQYILPSPKLVGLSLWHNELLIVKQAIPTIAETLLALLLGTLVGCFSSLTLIYFKPIRLWFLPVLIISQALPTFAIAPLFVIWLGYGMASKVALAMLMIFFPIASNFYEGLKSVPQEYLDLAQVAGASRLKTLIHIQIPAALPSLASGLKIAATIAPIGAVIGEWVGASEGLGYLLLNANARMQISLMFAVLVVITVFTLLLYYSVDFGLRRWVTW